MEETKRNYMYMNLYNFNVDGIYINRILPQNINNAFFLQWIDLQKNYTTELKETFAALPIYEIPWYDEELRGEAAIKRIIEDTLPDNVFESRVVTERETYVQNDKGYLLKVFCPMFKKRSWSCIRQRLRLPSKQTISSEILHCQMYCAGILLQAQNWRMIFCQFNLKKTYERRRI